VDDEVPFARRAREQGRAFRGGKVDDISVVVAVISPADVPKSQAQTQTQQSTTSSSWFRNSCISIHVYSLLALLTITYSCPFAHVLTYTHTQLCTFDSSSTYYTSLGFSCTHVCTNRHSCMAYVHFRTSMHTTKEYNLMEMLYRWPSGLGSDDLI